MGGSMGLPWDQYLIKRTSAAANAEKTPTSARSHDESGREHTQNGSCRAPKVEEMGRINFGSNLRTIKAAENQDKEMECLEHPAVAQQNERRSGRRTHRMSVQIDLQPRGGEAKSHLYVGAGSTSDDSGRGGRRCSEIHGKSLKARLLEPSAVCI